MDFRMTFNYEILGHVRYIRWTDNKGRTYSKADIRSLKYLKSYLKSLGYCQIQL